jgi:ubiquinone/menaquinone biosynthesis C-methylase UbiE
VRSTSQEAAQAYDALASKYDHHHVDAKSLAENRHISRYLRRRISPGMKVVDLGCGTGLLQELCPVAAEDYLGVDISHGMLQEARRKYPRHRFEVGDMERRIEAVPDGWADRVVSLFGSPSYCDLTRVEAQVRRMLRPGGAFFLMFCSPLYVHRETYITRSSNLLIPYTEADLRAVLRPDAVWGMSRVVDRLPKRTPAWLMNPLLALEVATWGRLHQDGCFFLNAWGRK